jgi:hypothetical protein
LCLNWLVLLLQGLGVHTMPYQFMTTWVLWSLSSSQRHLYVL